MNLEVTEREVEVIRQALRYAEETHKRNDFKVLVLEAQDLRSKINDAIISQQVSNGLAR
jgi:Arc/MetJ-type ribon-helix-helix transcriptional regulator